jgi:hypothetical protein
MTIWPSLFRMRNVSTPFCPPTLSMSRVATFSWPSSIMLCVLLRIVSEKTSAPLPTTPMRFSVCARMDR